MLPKRLKKEPLIETIWTLGVKFHESKKDLLPDLLYNHLKARLKTVNKETKPHHDIPSTVRLKDPVLSKVPHTVFNSESSSFFWKISDESMSISAVRPYPGWEALYGEIKSLLSLLLSEELIVSVGWISFRYIDLIEREYMKGLEGLKLELKLGEWTLEDSRVLVNVEKPVEGCLCRLTIINPAEVSIRNEYLSGCLIDTEVYLQMGEEKPSEEYVLDKSTQMHDLAKRIFFEHILKKELIQKLEPEV